MRISLITYTRNRDTLTISRQLESAAWQTHRPHEHIVVSEGSQPDYDEELGALREFYDFQLITCGSDKHSWWKAFGFNVGIRATSPESEIVMMVDADMALHPGHVKECAKAFKENREIYWLAPCLSLGRGDADIDPFDYGVLRKKATFRPHGQIPKKVRLRGPKSWAQGGCAAFTREWLFQVHGYDERFIGRGGHALEILERGRRSGLQKVWLPLDYAMLHQWHPRQWSVPSGGKSWKVAHAERMVNKRLLRLVKNTGDRGIPVRNPDGWGGQS
jgi:GT2 family glycosyltransferase